VSYVYGAARIFLRGVEYAQVTKMLGNGRLEAMCFDGTKRLCHIRGKLRKKVWTLKLTDIKVPELTKKVYLNS